MYLRIALLLLACASLFGAEEPRVFALPLSVEQNSGAYVSGGRISLKGAVPSQPGNVKYLALEAENYDDVFWQDVDKSGTSSEAIMDALRAHGQNRDFEDPEAAGGKYIERATTLVLPVIVRFPGTYQVWTRLWRPSGGHWVYNQQVGTGAPAPVVLASKEFRTWYWQQTGTVELRKGFTTVTISNLHGGKRLDRIVLHPDAEFVPEGLGPPATPSAFSKSATLDFKTLRLPGVKAWRRVHLDRLNAHGRVSCETSFDEGGTWTALPFDGALSHEPQAPPASLRVRLTLETDGPAEIPVLALPEVLAEVDPAAYPQLAGENVRYTFSARTGALAGIETLGAGSAKLVPPGLESPAFRVFVKPDDGKNDSGLWLDAASGFKLVEGAVSGREARFQYRGLELPIEVVTRYTLTDAGYLESDVTVKNGHAEDVLQVHFPILEQVRIGADGRDDTLLWPYGTGKKFPDPTTKAALESPYPIGPAGYFDLYDGQAGFYLGTHDPKLVSSVFKAAPDASRTWMGFSLLRQDRIKAGGGEATFHAALGAHAGDWHAGALWYKAWFRTVFPDATWPAWTADTDGWMFGNVSFQRPGFQYESMTEGVLRKAIEMGFSHVQVWGSDTAQSCPCYYYPPDDAGGPEAFAKLNKSWREQGGQIGYYILPQGPSTWVFDDACKDFFGTPWERMPDWAAPPGKKEGKAWQWLLENARYGSPARKPPEPKAEWPGEMEKIRASGFRGGYPWAYTAMSAYSKPWRDWLTFWVAEKYAGDFHCTTAYLDTFHTQGYIPEYNPHLGMHGEGRGGYHRSQLAKRILEESRKRNPDFLPIMEMQCDAYQPYMAQQVGSSSMDSEMLRFTHPDHLQFEGQSGSGWGAKRFKRFNSAWMYGTRLDHREEEPWAVEVVRLRNWITRWINEARFLDDLGLEIDGNLPLASQFKGRIMLSESELNGKLHRVLSPDGTRGFLAQFWNRSRRDWPEGNATLEGRAWHDYRARIDLTPLAELDAAGTAPADWIPTRAVLLELGRPPREIRFETVYRGGRPTVEFLVPARQLCGILFVREARGVHSLLSHWDQRDFRQMDVHLYNPTQRAISGEVRAASAHAALETAKLPFSVGPGELATVSFPYADPAALRRPEIVDLEVEAEGAVRKLRAGAYPFMDDPSFEFDRFGGTYHEAAAADGKRSLLAGSKKVLNYRLEPAAKYRLSFAARALEGAFGASVDVNRILGKNNAIDGRYLRFRESFEVNDRDWTRVSFTLLTPAPFHPGNLYFLAGEGKALLLDDFRLEKLPDDAEVEHLPDTVTTMPNARDVK